MVAMVFIFIFTASVIRLITVTMWVRQTRWGHHKPS